MLPSVKELFPKTCHAYGYTSNEYYLAKTFSVNIESKKIMASYPT